MMGRCPDSPLVRRCIVSGMTTVGMMNKQIARHFQACECTISNLRTKMGDVKNRYHADRQRKTTRRKNIDNVTSFRRNRFLSSSRLPGFERNAKGTRIFCQNSSKTTEWCALR